METIWPLTERRNSIKSTIDRLAHRVKRTPGFCNICGKFTIFKTHVAGFREHVECSRCGSRNRQRQIASVLMSYALDRNQKPTELVDYLGSGPASRRARRGPSHRYMASVKDLPKDIVVWNTETTRAFHASLKSHLDSNYVSTEFIDPSLVSGDVLNGVMHGDIQNSHFSDDSLDFMISGDVFEHIPFPDKAISESYRILKPGGCHIFTAPFYHHRFTNERRASLRDDGTVEQHMKPWYHDDPMRPEGALVFNIFAPELLCMMEKQGFEVRLLKLHSPLYGIYGQNAIVLVARKTMPSASQRDAVFMD